jgi:hypothetical protein
LSVSETRIVLLGHWLQLSNELTLKFLATIQYLVIRKM